MRLFRLVIVILSVFLAQEGQAQEENILNPKEEAPGQGVEVQPGPRTTFQVGGALWMRSSFQDWQANHSANRQGFYFDQFRLAVSGEHGTESGAKLKFSTELRWWSYQFALQHMWFALEIDEFSEVRYGVTQVPFGALPSISSSFWYSLNYYLGLEGDHDAGLHYIYEKSGLNLQFAYFRNAEYNDPTATNRWAPDIVVGNNQFNFERDQFNLRFAQVFGYGSDHTTELGLSGQYGQLYNQNVDAHGSHWAASIHYVGHYRTWNIYSQVTRYEYNPENPQGMENNVVLMGFFSDQRLVAARGTTFVSGLRKHWEVDWWSFKKMNAYLEYSTVLKDDPTFRDSKLFNPGAVLQAGPFYLWVDFLVAQNSWWFNDSQTNSGLGRGANEPESWEFRYNFSLQWYF